MTEHRVCLWLIMFFIVSGWLFGDCRSPNVALHTFWWPYWESLCTSHWLLNQNGVDSVDLCPGFEFSFPENISNIRTVTSQQSFPSDISPLLPACYIQQRAVNSQFSIGPPHLVAMRFVPFRRTQFRLISLLHANTQNVCIFPKMPLAQSVDAALVVLILVPSVRCLSVSEELTTKSRTLPLFLLNVPVCQACLIICCEEVSTYRTDSHKRVISTGNKPLTFKTQEPLSVFYPSKRKGPTSSVSLI